MLTSDAKAQRTGLDAICSALKKSTKTAPYSLVRAHVAALVRFATESPFELIRERLTRFLEDIAGVRILAIMIDLGVTYCLLTSFRICGLKISLYLAVVNLLRLSSLSRTWSQLILFAKLVLIVYFDCVNAF